MDDRIPPQDLDAERSVLGCIMLVNDRLDDALQILDAEDFYSDAHQRIFSAILRLRERNKPFDPVTIGHELTRVGDYQEVGGAPYLAQILEAVPHASHTEHYAGIVKEKATRRIIIDKATDALRRAFGEMDMDDVLAETDRDFTAILESSTKDEAQDLGDVLLEAFAEMEQAQAGAGGPESANHPTGLEVIDDITGGTFNSELVVLAARPSIGKSALMGRIARLMAEAGVPSLIFSLEQGQLELAERLMAAETQINTHSLRTGQLDEAQHEKLARAGTRLSDLPITIDDRGGMTLARIKSLARIHRRKGARIIFVDYLQLIRPDNPRDPREQQVAKMSRGLKELAKDIKVPVVVLAQLNREVEKRQDKRPRLSDLRESGAIEADADQVWLLHRPESGDQEREGEAQVIVAKNRNGRTGTAQLEWLNFCCLFRDYHGPTTQAQLPLDGNPDRGVASDGSL